MKPRALYVLLISLLVAATPASATYAPPRAAAPSAAVVAGDAAINPETPAAEASLSKKERRLQKLLHHIQRALPHAQDGASSGEVDVLSLVSMILGILAIVGSLFIGAFLFLGLPALILGILGLGSIRRGGKKGLGFAITGIITGAIATLIVLIAVVFIASFF